MNETSIVHHVDRAWQVGERKPSDVVTFEDDDPRVASELPVELSAADVHRDDLCGSSLEQHVGKAPRGGTNVERGPPANLDAERIEGRGRA